MRKNGGWPSHRKKNFFMNNSVGLSMCDCPIETVKYIWKNIWYMVDWILSQNCWNTLPLHTVHSGSWTTRSEKCKNLKCCCARLIACSQRRHHCLPDGRIWNFKFGCDFAKFEQFSTQELRGIFSIICIA